MRRFTKRERRSSRFGSICMYLQVWILCAAEQWSIQLSSGSSRQGVHSEHQLGLHWIRCNSADILSCLAVKDPEIDSSSPNFSSFGISKSILTLVNLDLCDLWNKPRLHRSLYRSPRAQRGVHSKAAISTPGTRECHHPRLFPASLAIEVLLWL